MTREGETMRFLADMNLSPLTVSALTADGMDIVRVSDVLPANASDETILDLARREGRVVITQDLDFSALLALGGYDRPSLVTLRLLDTDPDEVTQRLRQALSQVEVVLGQGCAVTVEETAVRARRLPIR